MATSPSRTELEALWMPFTANRQFKANPRLLARAEGMHYWTPDGRRILDGVSGLWCVNAGHGRRQISEAVSNQIATMEYAPPFQMGHPIAFELANRLVELTPGERIRFTDQQPVTTWMRAIPEEYGFYANVNPTVSHPRWSQARENRLPAFLKNTPTQMFNGYSEVAGLYAGMDLRKNF